MSTTDLAPTPAAALRADLAHLTTDTTRLAPPASVGTDPRRAVEVSVDAVGLPATFRLRPDWPTLIDAEDLAPAVMAANRNARDIRTAALSEAMIRSGWGPRADTVLDQYRARARVAAAAHQPATHPPVAVPDTRQALRDLTADLLELARSTDRPHRREGSTGLATGTDASRQVSVTLSGEALTDCRIDGRWARDRTAAQVSNALAEALHHARTHLAVTRAQPAPPSATDRLYDRATAVLAQLATRRRPPRP